MAKQKYNWPAIRKDYYAGKYRNLKELATAHKMSYSYLKKEAAKWNKNEPELISDLEIEEAQKVLDMPEDRKERVTLMYDKLSEIVFRALNNPEGSFFTLDGNLKTKQFLDCVSAVEKIDKGYSTGDEGKMPGKLGEYSEYFSKLKEDFLNGNHEEEEENKDE